MRWCSDAFEILCYNGEKLRVIFSMNSCDREIISCIAAAGGISSEVVKDLKVSSVEYRFGRVDRLPHKIQWLCDNTAGYTSREATLFASIIGLEVCTTPYYSPESNGTAESLLKTFETMCTCVIYPMQKGLWAQYGITQGVQNGEV